MNAVWTSVAYALVDFLAASTLALLGVLASWRYVAQPARRMVLARATLVALALLAAVSFVPGWPRWSLNGKEPPAEIAVEGLSEETAADARLSPAPLRWEAPAPAAPARRLPATTGTEAGAAAQSAGSPAMVRTVPWPAVLVAAQGLVGLVVGLWLAWGAVQTGRMRRGAVEAPIFLQALLQEVVGRRRVPRLLLSPAARNPLALGVLRPTIILPSDLAAEPGAQGLRSVLAHEWAHLRHGDLWFLALGRCLLPLLAIHPLYHLLWRRIRDDQEVLADAAAAGADRPAYAEELLRWARRAIQSTSGRLVPLPGICESPSQLSRRIAMLLDERIVVETHCSGRWRYRALLVAAVAMLGVSMFTFRPALSGQTEAVEKDAAAKPAEPQPAQEQGKPLTYTGTVTEKGTGKPIAGATVTVRRSIVAPFERRLIEESRHKTDAAGKYTFTIPAEQVAERFLYIELDVSHPDYAPRRGFGYALSMIRKNEALGERPFFEHVELLPGEPVTGTVLTPDGQPVVGMKVLAFSMAGRHDFDSASFAPGTTDEKGAFRVNLVQGGDGVLWLLPKQYAPSTHVLLKQRGDLGQFVLQPGIVVKGRVLDAQGSPVGGVWANARITGGPAKKSYPMPVVDMLARSALTDSQGEFTLAPLPAGEYVVQVDEYPRDNLIEERVPRPVPAVFGPQPLTLKQGETTVSVEVRALPEVVVEGQYYDSHGKPRLGHEPDLWGQMPGEEMSTPSGFFHTRGNVDANGRFVIRAPKGLQQAKLSFITNEHSALRVRLEKDGPLMNQTRDIDLGTLNGDVRGIEVVRYEAPILLVKPVAEDGTVFKEAKLRFEYAEGRSPMEGRGRFVEGHDVNYERQPDGGLRSSQLLPDEKFTVTVSAEGRLSKSQTLQLPEGAVKELEVVLPKVQHGADKPAIPKEE